MSTDMLIFSAYYLTSAKWKTKKMQLTFSHGYKLYTYRWSSSCNTKTGRSSENILRNNQYIFLQIKPLQYFDIVYLVFSKNTLGI